MQLHHKNKKLNAFGLFEIVLSLAIFGIGIISLTSMNAKTYKVIKNNELSDFANRTMVKTLEFFKSPTTSSTGTQQSTQKIISDAMFNEPVKILPPFITIQFNIDPSAMIDTTDQLAFIKNSDSTPIVDCSSTSSYKVFVSSGSNYEGLIICNQIIVDKMTNGYKITSRIVYIIDGEIKKNELIGYRPFTYESD